MARQPHDPNDPNAPPASAAPQAAATPGESPLPKLPEQLPGKNDNPQHELAGLIAALRPALYAVHSDFSRGMQVEFEQAVIVQCVLQILMMKGLIRREELDQVYPQMRKMMAELRTTQLTGPKLYQSLDGVPEPKDLDCSAHHDACGAACCTSFSVVLTAEEAASGKYLWDIAFPYRLLVDAQGTCVYLDRERLACTIWQDRPAACRTFDCRKDDRIWSDYATRGLSAEAMNAKARMFAARQKAASPAP